MKVTLELADNRFISACAENLTHQHAGLDQPRFTSAPAENT
ncbi:hypothetical protein [Streptomyces sp. NPDC048612]